MNEFIKNKIKKIRRSLHENFPEIEFSDEDIIEGALAYYLSALRRDEYVGSVEN